ncbi:glycosyltransferase involved in cell wall biosynthesis [Algoriphagus ratkowskyi]|uniref:Glycosyltransferase family 4 protein n=1 Tax=Algoriphagus ratkowskyi TaxID=57028 RepID=A0A2W7R515_9BACT|nr:glycosyltransferase family 4 protein [Algoriphagus ratkowskyi]PZX55963.1 glycosyltransferase involved in cell wall biosynthesis [Algoriphagus ratkowskyi]TXD77224.1 glycosyltransferase family 4 protein [Algoriphagus ratkowskyi]
MIIYTYPVRTAFTDRDLEMISPELAIKGIEFTQSPIKLPFYFILQFFQLLWFLPKTNQYLCFFGGYHSVLPVWFGKVFHKKCVIQAGGTDCINMPEIDYGNFRKKWLRKATVYSFKNCSLILPVAEALVKQEYRYDPTISPKQGLLNLIPFLSTPIHVIPNGFDTDFWKDQNLDRLPNSLISIATGTSKRSRAIVKGYDLIEKLASLHPDINITLVGDENYSSPSQNIKVVGKQSRSELHKLYNSNHIYLQLSTSEGFPNALAEAMACGCIPIGSAVGAIPEIIGSPELILKTKNFDQLESIVQNLIKTDTTDKRNSSRERIVTNFSYQKRKAMLLSELA